MVTLTQKPEEAWIDQCIIMSEYAAIRLFMKWKAFENIPFDGNISYKELAKNVKQKSLSRVSFVIPIG